MDNTLDPNIIALTRAIKKNETGTGDTYNLTPGKDGEIGAYQFLPSTWKTWAKEHLGDENAPTTMENQNKVAYAQVKKFKDAGYNPGQIASLWNSGKSDPTGNVGISKGGAKYDTPAYVNKVYADYETYKGSTPTSNVPIPASDIVNNRLPEQALEQPKEPGIISQSFSQIGKGYNQISEGVNNPNIGEGLLDIGKGALNEAAGGIRAVFSPVEWATKMVAKIPGISDALGGVDKGVNLLADKISESPALQKFAMNNPDAEEVIGNLLTVGGALVGGKEAPEIKAGLKEVSEPLTNIVKDKVTTPIRTALEDKYVASTTEDWNRIGGDYVKTDKLLSQGEKFGKDTPKFLSEMGINPNELIEGGKFSKASEVADKLTSESVRPYEDILTQELKVAQQGQPLVDVSELHSGLIKNINDMSGIIPDKKFDMISEATSKMRKLQTQYPNGIPLDKLNEVKGDYWRDTKFDLSKPLNPQINYAIGKTIKETIESKVPDANIKELNSLLGDYYAAGKFLRGLNDKVPKLTTGQKITRGVVKGLATVGGEKLFGLSGGIGGFLLGKSISHVLETASNPLKSWILSNLSKTDPIVYKQAIEWLGKQEEARLARLMLPEGAPLGTEKNPIITPNTKGTPNPVPSAVSYGRPEGGKTITVPTTKK